MRPASKMKRPHSSSRLAALPSDSVRDALTKQPPSHGWASPMDSAFTKDPPGWPLSSRLTMVPALPIAPSRADGPAPTLPRTPNQFRAGPLSAPPPCQKRNPDGCRGGAPSPSAKQHSTTNPPARSWPVSGVPPRTHSACETGHFLCPRLHRYPKHQRHRPGSIGEPSTMEPSTLAELSSCHVADVTPTAYRSWPPPPTGPPTSKRHSAVGNLLWHQRRCESSIQRACHMPVGHGTCATQSRSVDRQPLSAQRSTVHQRACG